MKRWNSFLLILAFLLPVTGTAESKLLWEGGLWNLDYSFDNSTYGHFRLSVEVDSSGVNASGIVKIEWVESLNSKGERVYASRLLPELGNFIKPGVINVEMGKVPSAIKLENADGQLLWLRLWEPTRFAITAEEFPCDGVDLTLSSERRQEVEGPIAKQLHVENIEVLSSLRYEGWSIFYVETFVTDEPFLFYSADPMTNNYVALWSGAAAHFEEQEIKDWVMKNASGIPVKLVNCFAWHVTKAPRQ